MGILDKINQSKIEKTNNPINTKEIFYSLNKQSGYEYLREAQGKFLDIWEERKNNRDIVGVLNTGAGKTLLGLLILLSKLREEKKPCVYLCPTRQLVDQVVDQANKFGIPVCKLSGALPISFLNSELILVTTFEKMFNGKTIFGIEGGNRETIEIGSIVVDDVHYCVERARKQFTLEIDKNTEAYNEIFNLFKDEIDYQSHAKLNSIKNNEGSVTQQIPYWAWQDKQSQVLRIIDDYYKDSNSTIRFSYKLIIDNLQNCQCFISGSKIEITPFNLPVYKIVSFNKANHRYIFSATINNKKLLMTDLDIDKTAIEEPIKIQDDEIGERLIIAPTKYSNHIDSTIILRYLSKFVREKPENIVVLVPSIYVAKKWMDIGGTIIQNNMSDALKSLKETKHNLFIFVNRYDGLDLAADSCHFLVLDGLPDWSTLQDKASANVKSTLSNMARRVEQGLGRTVRSAGDYSMVFLMGDDLIRFTSLKSNMKFFSKKTQGQLKLMYDLITPKEIKNNSPKDALMEVENSIDLCLNRNKDWINMYKSNMQKAEKEYSEYNPNIDMIEMEKKAFDLVENNKYQKAVKYLDNIITNFKLEKNEKAWYLQLKAEILYSIDSGLAHKFQTDAKNINSSLLKPKDYKYITKSAQTQQVKNIQKTINKYLNITDYIYNINTTLEKLNYSNNDVTYEQFEEAVANLGKILGFASTRPEKELGDGGPDVLWVADGYVIVNECKNQVEKNKISKKNMGQIEESINWTMTRYLDVNNTIGLIWQSNNKLEQDASGDKKIRVVTQEKLQELVTNVERFIDVIMMQEANGWKLNELSEIILKFNLDIKHFIDNYSVLLK